jgi:20S proteasome alpha/beta subunit
VHSSFPAGVLSRNVANVIFFTIFFNLQIQERFGGGPLNTGDVVQMVSGVVFNRRFNSCIESNTLGALDINGFGAVFNYDEIGRFQRVAFSVTGPENQFIQQHLLNARAPGLTQNDLVRIVGDAYVTATAQERDTGEQVEILIIKSNGVQRLISDL